MPRGREKSRASASFEVKKSELFSMFRGELFDDLEMKYFAKQATWNIIIKDVSMSNICVLPFL